MKYLTILFLSLLIISCNKNDKAPMFSCDVNDVRWNPSLVSVGRNHETNLLILQIKDDTLSLILKIDANGIDKYDLSPDSKHKVFVDISHPPYSNPYASTYKLSNGNFTIKEIKGFKKIMKGSFSFDAYDDNGEKISFTNGEYSGYTYLD